MKDGIAYDPDALIAATTGTVGSWPTLSIMRWPLNALSGTAAVVALLLAAKHISAVRAVDYARRS